MDCVASHQVFTTTFGDLNYRFITKYLKVTIISGLAWSSLACTPFGVVSILLAGCYTLSWQWDPCCKYQEEKDLRRLSKLPILSDLTSASPVVLVHTDNRRKIILHSTVSLAAAAICVWRIYNILK